MDYIYGANAVREAIRSGNAICVYLEPNKAQNPIALEAASAGIPIHYITRSRLNGIANSVNHQGFVAKVREYSYLSIEDLITICKNGGPNPMVMLLDGIQDPHNLGAILRSADAFGVKGIVIKNHGQAKMTATVMKVSTGAANYVPVATVTNLTSALNMLKKSGFWIVGTDGEATETIDHVDLHRPLCVIIGSEGKGISPLLKRECDYLIKIPMVGHVNSLNASVSAGIILALITYLK